MVPSLNTFSLANCEYAQCQLHDRIGQGDNFSVYVISILLSSAYWFWGYKDEPDMLFVPQVAHCLGEREAGTYFIWIYHGWYY